MSRPYEMQDENQSLQYNSTIGMQTFLLYKNRVFLYPLYKLTKIGEEDLQQIERKHKPS